MKEKKSTLAFKRFVRDNKSISKECEQCLVELDTAYITSGAVFSCPTCNRYYCSKKECLDRGQCHSVQCLHKSKRQAEMALKAAEDEIKLAEEDTPQDCP